MKTLIVAILILSGFMASAQEDRWKISLNGKVLLNTAIESETKNVKAVSSTEWKKNGKLEIHVYGPQPNMWKRSFHLNDETDNLIFSADSTNYAGLSLTALRKLFEGKKELRIYTILMPTNPDLAVRIRRVHLCTLRLP